MDAAPAAHLPSSTGVQGSPAPRRGRRILKRCRCSLPLALALAGCVDHPPRPLDPAQLAERLEQRTLDDPAFREFLAKALADTPGSLPQVRWDLDALTVATAYFSPVLALARAEWSSSGAAETTAGALPNPTVSAGPEYNFNAGRGVTPWIGNFNLDWPLETAGKRARRQERARSLTEAARLRAVVELWQARGQLRAAMLDRSLAVERARLIDTQVVVGQQLVDRLESKIRAGAATRLEAAPTRLALERQKVEALAARREASAALPRIAAIVGLPVAALSGLTLATSLELPPVPRLAPREVRAAALRGRAVVLAALAEYAAAEAALRLELARQYPDLHLGTGYQYDQGENKWSVGVGLEIPLLNRNEGPIAEALALREKCEVQVQAAQGAVLAELDAATAAWTSAEEELQALVPLRASQQSQLEATRALVRVGVAEPSEALAAELEVAAGAIAELDARGRALRALGQLEDAVQRPVAIFTRLDGEAPAEADPVRLDPRTPRVEAP